MREKWRDSQKAWAVIVAAIVLWPAFIGLSLAAQEVLDGLDVREGNDSIAMLMVVLGALGISGAAGYVAGTLARRRSED